MTPAESTPGQIAQEEIARFHASGSPGYTGVFSDKWKLLHGGHAVVWKFQGDKWGNFEAIAYIPQKGVINFVVITAQGKQQFDAAYPSFRELVCSYQWLTANVKFDQAGKPTGLPKTR